MIKDPPLLTIRRNFPALDVTQVGDILLPPCQAIVTRDEPIAEANARVFPSGRAGQ
jgi:hypothetical protein